MPGAPTGRACNACRKLKKKVRCEGEPIVGKRLGQIQLTSTNKCDQKQPKCSRCVRLGIPCIGSGQLRYKFMGKSFGDSASSSSEAIVSPATSPSNGLSRLIDGFASMLDVSEVGIDISIYGPFFEDIPRRLGTNEALDSAAQAFVTSFPCVRTREVTGEMYKSCNTAITKLILALNDPEKNRQPETLCAVYMTMIFQGWILKRDDLYAAHGDALVHLVNQAAVGKYKDRFEGFLVMTLQVLVVIVSLIDSTMKPDLALWSRLPEHHGPVPPIDSIQAIESMRLDHMVKVVRLVQNYEQNIPGLCFAYDKLKADCVRMGQILLMMEQKAAASTSPPPLNKRKLHVRFQNSYSILLHIALTLHNLLDHEDVLGESKDDDVDFMVEECIRITHNSMQYRPLGSSNVPFCLSIAYVMTKNEHQKARIHDLLQDWEDDFEATNWLGIAKHAETKMNQRGWIFLTHGSF